MMMLLKIKTSKTVPWVLNMAPGTFLTISISLQAYIDAPRMA
jgi:hypothetical protein